MAGNAFILIQPSYLLIDLVKKRLKEAQEDYHRETENRNGVKK